MNGATEDENTGIAQGGNANVGQMQLTPNSHIGLYSNHFGAQQQQDAFDQAYSHK